MNMQVLREFLTLASAFRVRFDDETVAYIMQNGLDDVNEEQFKEACQYALRNCRFMPSVAELRNIMERRHET